MQAIELQDRDIVAYLLWRFATTRFRITDADVERFIKARLSVVVEPDPESHAVTIRLLTETQAERAAEGTR
jgi:hypothetical protein